MMLTAEGTGSHKLSWAFPKRPSQSCEAQTGEPGRRPKASFAPGNRTHLGPLGQIEAAMQMPWPNRNCRANGRRPWARWKPSGARCRVELELSARSFPESSFRRANFPAQVPKPGKEPGLSARGLS
eukprot:4370601-Alexandrium_andersonii.AAC.1